MHVHAKRNSRWIWFFLSHGTLHQTSPVPILAEGWPELSWSTSHRILPQSLAAEDQKDFEQLSPCKVFARGSSTIPWCCAADGFVHHVPSLPLLCPARRAITFQLHLLKHARPYSPPGPSPHLLLFAFIFVDPCSTRASFLLMGKTAGRWVIYPSNYCLYGSLNSEDDIICYKCLSKVFSCAGLHAVISVHIVSFFLLYTYFYVHDCNGIEIERGRDTWTRMR